MWNEHRGRFIGVGGCLGVVAILFLTGSFRSAPQIGADPRVFKTVDALFTALTSRDKARLDDCEQRLRSYRDDGHLPPKAASYLDAVIDDARSGRWEPAAHRLYDFMLQQRGA